MVEPLYICILPLAHYRQVQTYVMQTQPAVLLG